MNNEVVEERVQGTVLEFDSRRGFGFIQPVGVEDKEKRVFCHWKQLLTDDRWPQLASKMRVEYTPKKDDRGKIKAERVTMVGGGKISLGEDSNKNYNTTKKYKGKVQFYDSRKGFGFIIPILEGEGKIMWAGEIVDSKKGLYAAREEIFTDDEPPALNDGMEVEFIVYHHLTKGLGAGHISSVGGGKIVYKKSASSKWDRDRSSSRGRGPWRSGLREKRPPGVSIMAVNNKDEIEIGLYVENRFIGRLIGKEGESINKIRKFCGGVNVQFGDSRQKSFADRQVVSIVGNEEDVTTACVEILKKLNVLNDAGKTTLVFLVPSSYCGMFIGKKGSNLNQIQEESGAGIDVSKMPVQLAGGSLVALAEVRGSVSQIGDACGKIVPILGNIAKRLRQDQMMGSRMKRRW